MSLLSIKIKNRLRQYYYLTRLNRPIGIFLLLWPALWAIWVASEGKPDSIVLFVFILGAILMRSAGCVINDYADRNIDKHVERTRNRPITSGKVSKKEALLLFAGLSLTAFALVFLTNRFTVYLSFGGVLLAAIYPFMKRYTHLPQVVLGMAFAWSVPMAFAAQNDEISKLAWLIYVITVIWAVVYDTMYAMVDREDDIKIGVKSTAILFGEADRLIIFVLQIMMFLGLILLGIQVELKYPYYVGLGLAGFMALYQQMLIRHRDPKACFEAFLNNNLLGGLIFCGLFISYH